MTERLRPSSENPWYWSDGDGPALLLGGTDKDNLFQWTGGRLEAHLDDLVDAGGNFVRNTMSDRKDEDVSPFERSEDGTYDLERWNDEYWDRFAAFLDATAERDIVVELTLWDQHDLAGSRWESHAWNPVNNDTLPADSLPATGGDHWQDRIAFFRTVEEGNDPVLAHQERFVDRILDHTLDYGHVVYNVTNEGWAGIEWELHWAEHLLERADERGVGVEIANMNMTPDESVRKVVEHPDLFSYVELSQHNQLSAGATGQDHWDNLQRWRSEVEDAIGPRPFNNVKIYGGFDGGKDAAGSADQAVRWFWRNVLGGSAACRFHRQVAGGDEGWGIGGSERALTQIRSVRAVEEHVALPALTPRIDLLADPAPGEAYCAADPGEAYVVYFPDGGEATLAVEPGPYRLRTLDAESAAWTDEEMVGGETDLSLTPPERPNQVVVLTAER
ncbi:hypothetical protein C475_20313 [Halosimplex carlsbadense 2-9-1]|uniref:Uncharacterized protein n=1 Tax=Halosimplex carlsbadense 2-9-1 TaxID=797114 RepID=M0CFI3_9EURY|nr:hypothetical protein [Halosimplex carlsbadense]ELZ20644.1 hypothetical protein C475_20313 [Halosimplex carlsbadense 2-9-1]